MVFSPDGRYILSASFDKSVKLWDGLKVRPIPMPTPRPRPALPFNGPEGPGGRQPRTPRDMPNPNCLDRAVHDSCPGGWRAEARDGGRGVDGRGLAPCCPPT